MSARGRDLGAAPAPAKPPRVSSPADPVERAAEDLARRALSGERPTAHGAVVHSISRTLIYRQPAAPAESLAPAEGSGRDLLVEDDQPTSDGQMRKSAFLDELYGTLCRTVEEGFVGSPYEGRGCPFLRQAIETYRGRSAAEAEGALRRWAGEARAVSTASGYIPVIEARVRRSVATYVATGEITGVPPDLMPLVPGLGGGLLGSLMTGGLLGGLTAGVGRLASGIGSALGRVLFKARAGTETPAADPETVRARLGPGHGLDSRAQDRMERAFGMSFSHVRIHDDERSTQAAEELNARAFTVGHQVAFGPGQYRPGTPTGDALLAHELAHVVQQAGGEGTGPVPALEADADETAVAAAEAIVDGATSPGEKQRKRARPRRRSGLQLLSCSGAQRAQPAAQHPPAAAGARTATGATGSGAAAAPAPASGRTWAPRPPRPMLAGAPQITDAQWAADRQAARAAPLPQRGPLLFAMVRQALASIGLQANLASYTSSPCPPLRDGTTPPGTCPNGANYLPTPVVNFDMNLNAMNARPRRAGDPPGRSLSGRAGFFFTESGNTYVILGPEAVEDTPDSVRRWAQHELLHTERHASSTHDAADELEAHTIDFVNYFHRFGVLDRHQGFYLGDSWAALLGYYERADDASKDKTFNMLVDFYNNQGTNRALFAAWLRRRAGDQRRDQQGAPLPPWSLPPRLATALNIRLP